MGKKEFGVNTKKEEARERKDVKKTEKKATEEKKKEDLKWEDNDKQALKKAQKEVAGHESRKKSEKRLRPSSERKTRPSSRWSAKWPKR